MKERTVQFAKFKALSFDIVGTLIDFEGGMLDYARSQASPGGFDEDAFLVAYRTARGSPDSDWYPDDLARVWPQLASKFQLTQTADAAEGFKQSVARWNAFPDAPAALQRLKKRFRLVGMTNTQRWAVGHFAQTLGNPFDDIVTADDARCEKPDPQFFAYTRGRLSMLDIGLHETLHVAQSQYHDIGVAHRLGYTTCWIERRAGQKGFGGTMAVEQITKPDFHFTDLAQLADAVDADR